MGFIYRITNKINNKSYIGKTETNIETRFKEHIKESKRERSKNRPLYAAIKKYGIENFKIELIEEIVDNLEEREMHYIQKYDTYGSTGYNATIGGDSKRYLNYDAIVNCYHQEQNITKVANLMRCDRKTVGNILRQNNVITTSSGGMTRKKLGKPVKQYSLKGEYIATYPSTGEAAFILFQNRDKRKHIAACASNIRKTAYGYKWKYCITNDDLAP
ncbi:MAG: GIY-YIG nuclease family protein [Candidatus Caldatribacteriota bacterium]